MTPSVSACLEGLARVWAMRSTIHPGDLIVLPIKTTKNIAFEN